ncbi:MAG: hypothetical protein ACLGI8_07060 [Acidimicrobiia bacterium]
MADTIQRAEVVEEGWLHTHVRTQDLIRSLERALHYARVLGTAAERARVYNVELEWSDEGAGDVAMLRRLAFFVENELEDGAVATLASLREGLIALGREVEG